MAKNKCFPVTVKNLNCEILKDGMGLRMKNYGVDWKIQFLGGWGGGVGNLGWRGSSENRRIRTPLPTMIVSLSTLSTLKKFCRTSFQKCLSKFWKVVFLKKQNVFCLVFIWTWSCSTKTIYLNYFSMNISQLAFTCSK